MVDRDPIELTCKRLVCLTPLSCKHLGRCGDEAQFGVRESRMVDRDPIEQLAKIKEEWRAKAHGYRTAVGGKYAVVGDAYARCADELDALLGSARLQKEKEKEVTRVDGKS